MIKWESEKHKSCGIPPKDFKGHVATDGSLLGTAGKWGACGWSVVQLDYDEELVVRLDHQQEGGTDCMFFAF